MHMRAQYSPHEQVSHTVIEAVEKFVRNTFLWNRMYTIWSSKMIFLSVFVVACGDGSIHVVPSLYTPCSQFSAIVSLLLR